MGRTSDAKERLMEAVLELIWKGSYGSTTIDLICDKAGVKKGSFYYFFNSKAELASAAMLTNWEVYRPKMDEMFSPSVPPLERLKNYCTQAFVKQSEMKCSCGSVLGCPIFTLGAEICTQDDSLRLTVQDILGRYRKYLESTIRDAQAEGLAREGDPAVMARMMFAFMEGVMTQARIHNDPNILKDLYPGTLALIGASIRELAPA
jgi:TetR/AcrR family transcriptional repressor of nem operon